MLEVRNLEVLYNDVILVLRGVSVTVDEGEIVALLGANGAGKTTLLRAISGLLQVHRGEMAKGSVALLGESVDGTDPTRLVRRGLAQVMEGRRVFSELTVKENLRSGAYTTPTADATQLYEQVLDLFPALVDKTGRTAGYLSGGEQQMVAIGRALMTDPKMLLLDEPSLGLAPRIVQQIGQIIQQVRDMGTSVLLVEQNAHMALDVADRAYVMENGRIVKEGTASALRQDADVREFYLGVGDAGRKSFRDVKSYRRRKRWSS